MLEDNIWLLKIMIIVIKLIIAIAIIILIAIINQFYIRSVLKKSQEHTSRKEFNQALKLINRLIKKEFFNIDFYVYKLSTLYQKGAKDEFNDVIYELKSKNKSLKNWLPPILLLQSIMSYTYKATSEGELFFNEYLKQSVSYSKKGQFNFIFYELLTVGIRCYFQNQLDDSEFFLLWANKKTKNDTHRFIAYYFLSKIYEQQGNNQLATIHRDQLIKYSSQTFYNIMIQKELTNEKNNNN